MAVVGDESAQLSHALYSRYYSNVYRYALSQLRSPQDAEDAAQNTFLRAFAALQKGVVPESEAAWLFKIAHNVCASSKLAWLRRRRVELPKDLDEVHVAAVEPDVDVSGLNDALASMPPRLREAFLLREWQGLSYAEIAERLDTSHSAVETLIFRARRHLANELRRAQQALTLGPLGAWLRGFFAGGGVARGVGLVAIAAAGVATASVVTPAGNRQAPTRTGPQQPVRAGILAPALPAAPLAAARRRALNTQVEGARSGSGTPAAPAADAPIAPAATVGGPTASPQPGTATPAAAPPSPTPATAPAGTVASTVSSPPLAPPAVTVPSASVPSATVPPASVPSATVPSVTVPAVTTPVATTPPVTTPSATLPGTLP